MKAIIKTIRGILFPVNLDVIFKKEYMGQGITTPRKFDEQMKRMEQRVMQSKNRQ